MQCHHRVKLQILPLLQQRHQLIPPTIAFLSQHPLLPKLPHNRHSLPSPTQMASFLLLPRSRPLFSLTLGLGLSSLYATQSLYRQKPLLCEAAGATPLTTVSESFKTYSRDAKVPVFKDGRPNPRAYGQISAGSILGMFASLLWSMCKTGEEVVVQAEQSM